MVNDVQSGYQETLNAGQAGQIASNAFCQIDSFVVKRTGATNIAAGIPWGRGVKTVAVATGDEGAYEYCDLGATVDSSPFATTSFLGVAIIDRGQIARTNTEGESDSYEQGRVAAIANQGEFWVEVDGNVEVGNDVSVNTTTGRFSTRAASASQAVIPGARWMSTNNPSTALSATNTSIAIVRLDGTIV